MPQRSSASRSTALSPGRSDVNNLSPCKRKSECIEEHGASTPAKKTPAEAHYKAWKGEDGNDGAILLSPHVKRRLLSTYTLPKESFKAFLSVYAEYKFSSATKGVNPYTVPEDFYKLFRAVAGVTHELFADAINAPGVLPHFCSINQDDLRFGAAGSWGDVEENVEGAAGHPPFAEETLLNILLKIHEQVATGRPYFRAMVLPFKEDTKVHGLVADDALGAEIVAVIQPKQQYKWFTHQLNYFRHDHQRHTRVQEEFTSPVCVAIWTNDEYQERHPPPHNVEDCFQAWEHSTFGPKSNVVDYNGVAVCVCV